MKSPNLAFILNFFFPGAGLCYLGKWLWGIANLAVVLGIGIVFVFFFDNFLQQHSSSIAAGIAGGCGGLALHLAKLQNKSNQNNLVS